MLVHTLATCPKRNAVAAKGKFQIVRFVHFLSNQLLLSLKVSWQTAPQISNLHLSRTPVRMPEVNHSSPNMSLCVVKFTNVIFVIIKATFARPNMHWALRSLSSYIHRHSGVLSMNFVARGNELSSTTDAQHPSSSNGTYLWRQLLWHNCAIVFTLVLGFLLRTLFALPNLYVDLLATNSAMSGPKATKRRSQTKGNYENLVWMFLYSLLLCWTMMWLLKFQRRSFDTFL